MQVFTNMTNTGHPTHPCPPSNTHMTYGAVNAESWLHLHSGLHALVIALELPKSYGLDADTHGQQCHD